MAVAIEAILREAKSLQSLVLHNSWTEHGMFDFRLDIKRCFSSNHQYQLSNLQLLGIEGSEKDVIQLIKAHCCTLRKVRLAPIILNHDMHVYQRISDVFVSLLQKLRQIQYKVLSEFLLSKCLGDGEKLFAQDYLRGYAVVDPVSEYISSHDVMKMHGFPRTGAWP